MARQILPHNGDGQPRRSQVLLRAAENNSIFGHVHRPGKKIGGHIAHNGHIPRIGHILPFGAVNGVVGTVVEVTGLGVQLELVLGGNVGVVFVTAVGGKRNLAVLLSLLIGHAGEIAGDGVIRPAGFSDEVQRNHGELAGGAALQKQHPIVFGHMEQPDEAGLGVVKDLLEHLGAVAHLHYGHAGALVVGDLAARPLQHLQRQHGRAGREIVDALCPHISSSLIFPAPFPGRGISPGILPL